MAPVAPSPTLTEQYPRLLTALPCCSLVTEGVGQRGTVSVGLGLAGGAAQPHGAAHRAAHTRHSLCGGTRRHTQPAAAAAVTEL